jgi:hypothetical protein
VYKFFGENKNLGKSFTVKHFTAEKVPRSTIYDILSRLENFPALTIQKMTQGKSTGSKRTSTIRRE